MSASTEIKAGLEGVVAAVTRLSGVDGEAGELIIAGFPLEELAPRATFEETVYLLWNDVLPDAAQLATFRSALAERRSLPAPTVAILREAAARNMPAMDALRIAAGTLDLRDAMSDAIADMRDTALRIVAQFPTIVATYSRLQQRHELIAPDPTLGHTANYLFMLTGKRQSEERVRALETYLNTVIDHGLNASTFAARTIIATGSDLVSAVTGAVGALKGPLHGGAPGPALDMVFEIGSLDRAETDLRVRLERGDRLMGFGHRIYKVRDPRADVLSAAATRLYGAGDGDPALYDLAVGVEQIALRLLEEYKPGRRLQTNVEYYTALLLHGLDLTTEQFSPTFAISRVAGWVAHCFEQVALNRIIRPQSVYSGPKDRRWVEVGER
jgi:citrate synthase